MKSMKTYKLSLPLLAGVLAVLGLLVTLNPDRATADMLREWDGNWYWKDGGWTDYAPNGVPDFDQKQAPFWVDAFGHWSHCGPVAAANSLWWFDSKFEPSPVLPLGTFPPPSPHNDNYYLVTSYGGWPPMWDDHDPINVGGMGALGLVDDLAWYFDTDGQRTQPGVFPWSGTEVHTMSYGLQWYLYGGNPAWGPSPYSPRYVSYYDDYHVQLVKMPTFEWVEEEVERSEDVILLLGFWQYHHFLEPGWFRIGGHYVTVAGINSTDLEIGFSDPFFDNAEAGGPGRVLSGTLIPHTPIPGHGPVVHNDAGNVSHDAYSVTLSAISPGGLWEIVGYPYDPLSNPNFAEQNCPEEFKDNQGLYWLPPFGDEIYAEVEYALAMSPFYWKPGGEWVWLWYDGEWMWEWWWYEDDGDSCLSDFWWGLDPAWEAYDGPVAVANSLWWFDSKAETLVTGGWPTEPPAESDHYNLVGPYGEWDDHAITNTTYFIDDLAQNYLKTNATISGTSREDMAAGIGAYLAASGVADDFYTKTQDSPSFEWVADEVETCEDVILLLGFYEDLGGGNWQRKGGHWVNAAGVNRESRLIGLSDPALDNAISHSIADKMYLGRVFPPEHLGTPFTDEEKKAPQSISHDIYSVVTSTSPGGEWALANYPATSVITSFIGLNGEGTEWAGHPISTEVEWAIGVSPYSDLVLTKTAVVTEIMPGDRVTYTLEYANTGLAAADNVTITDMLPLGDLTDVSYTSWPPISATQGVTYVWTLPRLSYGQSGAITVTAEPLVTTTLYNTAYITGLNAIGSPTPDRNPNNNIPSTVILVRKHGVDLQPDSASLTGNPGRTVTHTLTLHNTGNVADTYSIAGAISGKVWVTNWPTSIGPVAAGGSTQFNVTVQIPSGASDGDWSQAAITATSQGDGSKQDSSTLTTYAQSGTITRGITVTPISPTVSGDPGDTVCFTLTITNSGNVTDTATVTHTFPVSWTVTFTPPPAYVLGPGASQMVQVCITIPSGAGTGTTGGGTVTVISQGDPSQSADVDVEVRVGWKFIYLPIVVRNYP
jgi:uncharacterized repeat protein (TIGR01451 family)